MALVLAGKLLAMRREIDKLTLTIRPTTTIQQDGKKLAVMMEDDGSVGPSRSGHVIVAGADSIEVVIDWNIIHSLLSLLEFIQNTAIDQTVRLAVDATGSLNVTINDTPHRLVSFQRGSL